MLFALLAVLQQQPTPPKPVSLPRLIDHVELSPAKSEVRVGETVQLTARAVDSTGKTVPGVRYQFYTDGDQASVSETGLVRGGFRGTAKVTAVAGIEGSRNAFGHADIVVLPSAPARIEVSPVVRTVVAGTRLSLVGMAYSAENDRRYDAVTFSSSNPKVVQVTDDGRLTAMSAGSATITARAGPASSTMPVQVLAGPVSAIALTPDKKAVLTGDVVRFSADVRGGGNRALGDVAVRWSVDGSSPEQMARIEDDGAFVAETPGKYTVRATAGATTADAVVEVTKRKAGRPFEVLGRVPINFSSAEVWVHPSGKCAYLSTIADRVYAIDVANTGSPRIVDSMVTDARLVNDVMTTEDGRFGVFSREGASNRKNGIVIFDASDACHPKVIAEYNETVSGGVHSSFVYKGYVYLTDDATGSMRVIDIRDPYKPREVARWQTEQVEEGRYLHDIAVQDGLAYLSYWNDGLVILDVGKGIKGGSPEKPVFVAQAKYDLQDLYSRVDELYGLAVRGTHTAWRYKDYVFVGDEVYGSKMPTGLKDGNNLTFGRLSVIDVSDLNHPKVVAWYEPTDGGVHNIWAAGDTLFLGNYQGGARALDISGELRGDLLRQGREISWLLTADGEGNRPRATFAWGAVVKDGVVYVPDINTGLWILKLEPRAASLTP